MTPTSGTYYAGAFTTKLTWGGHPRTVVTHFPNMEVSRVVSPRRPSAFEPPLSAAMTGNPSLGLCLNPQIPLRILT